MTSESMITNERAFLHSIANPLATVYFLVDSVKESMQGKQELSEYAADLERVMTALDQVRTLIDARRKLIVEASKE